ncbi:TetR/AcrR family transcriptional regulator [Paenibacillaceae sp. P-4]|uniref:TetR/AcrR family transcriptional regulator n=1 Tax=Paenibacillaceae bacterium P-4 TaxID=3160969 RepID=UPI0032E81BA4
MKQPDKSLETKEKILNATLDMIKEEEFEQITIRKVASRSNTNIALINYYFGSKDALINEAIKILLSGFRSSFNVLDDRSIDPLQRLRLFLIQYVQVIQQYPAIISRTITAGSAMFASQQEYGQFLQAVGFDKVQRTIQEITREDNHEGLTMMMMQLFGAVFLPVLMKPLLESGTGVAVASVEAQIDLLFARYFHRDSRLQS